MDVFGGFLGFLILVVFGCGLVYGGFVGGVVVFDVYVFVVMVEVGSVLLDGFDGGVCFWVVGFDDVYYCWVGEGVFVVV